MTQDWPSTWQNDLALFYVRTLLLLLDDIRLDMVPCDASVI